MSKLSIFLQKHGEMKKECESGSTYYIISGKELRVSNHLSFKSSQYDGLSIFLPQNSKKHYIVSLLGNIYIHESYTSLRVFLESWIIISKEYDKRVKCASNIELRAQVSIIKELRESIKRLEANREIKLSDFTKNQQNVILSFKKQK